MFRVTKQFVGGNLLGITITETTSVLYRLNRIYRDLGSPFVVTRIQLANIPEYYSWDVEHKFPYIPEK